MSSVTVTRRQRTDAPTSSSPYVFRMFSETRVRSKYLTLAGLGRTIVYREYVQRTCGVIYRRPAKSSKACRERSQRRRLMIVLL